MINGMGDWNNFTGGLNNRLNAYLFPYLAEALSGKRKKKEEAERKKQEKA